MTVAALYCRISDDREGREVGVSNQRDALVAKAKVEGWTVPPELIFIENDTGATSRSKKPREKYDEMLAAARAGRFDVLACYSTSRLTRRPIQLEDWLDLADAGKLRAVFLTGPASDWSNPQGRAMARTLVAWDAAEAETISDRVAFQKLGAARKGKRMGGRRPFGYDLTSSPVPKEPDVLVINEAEAQRVRDAVRWILDGKALRQIGIQWNTDGVLTTAGKTWQTSTVRQVLMRPINGGLVQHQDEILLAEDGSYVRNQAPALVSLDDYLALRAVLTNPDRATTTTNEVRWLSSGLARCSKDGAPLRTATAGDKTRAYRCTASGCGLTIRAHHLDPAVRAAVLDEYMILPTAGTTGQQAQSQAVASLLRALDDIGKRQAELIALVAAGTKAHKIAGAMRELSTEETELHEALTAERSKSVHSKMMTEARRMLFKGGKVNLHEAVKVRAELGERFDALPIQEQRLIARAVLPSVKVYPGPVGGAHKNMAERANSRIVIRGQSQRDDDDELLD